MAEVTPKRNALEDARLRRVQRLKDAQQGAQTQGGSGLEADRAKRVERFKAANTTAAASTAKKKEEPKIGKEIVKSLLSTLPTTYAIGKRALTGKGTVNVPYLGEYKAPTTGKEYAGYGLGAAADLATLFGFPEAKLAVAAKYGEGAKGVASALKGGEAISEAAKIARGAEEAKTVASALRAEELARGAKPTLGEAAVAARKAGRAEKIAAKAKKPMSGKQLIAMEKRKAAGVAQKAANAAAKEEAAKAFEKSVPELAGIASEAQKAASQTRFFKKLADTGKSMAKSGTIAGTYGAAGALNENKDLGEVASSFGKGFAFGSALRGAEIGARAGLSKLGKTVGNAFEKTDLYKHVVGEASKVLSKISPGGSAAAKMIERAREETELNAAKRIKPLIDVLKPLSEKQRLAVADLVEGKAVKEAVTPQMQNAAKLIKDTLEEYADRAIKDEVKVRRTKFGQNDKGEFTASFEELPFTKRKNYFPRVLDNEQLTMNDKQRSKFAEHLVRTGQASSYAEAQHKIETFIQRFIQRRAGNLEYSRTIDLGDKFYIRDPLKVMQKYVRDSERRLTESKIYGSNDQNLYKVLSDYSPNAAAKDVQLGRKIIDRVLGKEEHLEPAFLSTARKLNNFNLGLAAISNATQTVNTVTKYGTRNAIRGLVDAFRKEGKDYALKSSAVMETTLQDLAPIFSGSKLDKANKKLFDFTGFSAVEKLNRTIAANAGKHFAFEQLRRLEANPGNKAAQAALREMGISPEILQKFGQKVTSLNDPLLLRAGQHAANYTQFRSAAQDLPLFFSSPYGKFLTQFKNFAFKQGQFFKKEVYDQALAGNYKPAIRMAAFAATLGEVSADVKALARGDEERFKKNGVARFLDNVGAIGGLGVMQDALKSAGGGSYTAARFLTGPSVSTAADLAGGVGLAVQGKPKSLEKTVAGKIPVVGPWLRSQIE